MAASLSRNSARSIRLANGSIDFWPPTPIASSGRRRPLWVVGDFYLNGYWQATARQAVGFKSGSGGQVTYRAAAVHRLVLWAGGLSTAGGLPDLLKIQVVIPKSSKTTHRFPGRAHRTRSDGLWHAHDAADQGDTDLQTHEEPTGRSALAWS